jgi:hypothetical protein
MHQNRATRVTACEQKSSNRCYNAKVRDHIGLGYSMSVTLAFEHKGNAVSSNSHGLLYLKEFRWRWTLVNHTIIEQLVFL